MPTSWTNSTKVSTTWLNSFEQGGSFFYDDDRVVYDNALFAYNSVGVATSFTNTPKVSATSWSNTSEV